MLLDEARGFGGMRYDSDFTIATDAQKLFHISATNGQRASLSSHFLTNIKFSRALTTTMPNVLLFARVASATLCISRGTTQVQ